LHLQADLSTMMFSHLAILFVAAVASAHREGRA